jgi:hypothetical protein
MNDQRSFEDRIATELGTMAGPEPQVDAMAVAHSVAATAPKRRFAPMFSSLKFVAAGMVLAVLGGSLLVTGIATIDNDPAQMDIATPIPTYTFKSHELGSGDVELDNMTMLQDGTIIVQALDNEMREASMWSSNDQGETWTQNPTPQIFADLVHHAGGLVALASDQLTFDNRVGPLKRNQIWTSTDGVAWELVATLPDASIDELSAGPEGLVAVGADRRGEEVRDGVRRGFPTMWTSQDGADWTAHEIAEPLPISAWRPGDDVWGEQFSEPVRSDDGVWLVLGAYQEDSGDDVSVLWRSEDGSTWDVINTEDLGSPFLLARTPSGFVINTFTAISDDEFFNQAWTSSDGLAWDRAGEPLPDSLEANGAGVTDEGGPVFFPVSVDPFDEDEISFPVEQLAYRFSDTGWEPLDTGIQNAVIGAGAMSPNGTMLLTGSDISECESAFCIWEPGGGDTATIWIGTPE